MRVVYPGTFDPFTNGHLDVVRRGRELFGSLTVAVAESADKRPMFSAAERVEMVRESVRELGDVEVTGFDGALVDFLAEVDARVVLRGLRTLSDFDNEMQMALFNRQLDPRIETVFIMASPEHSATSSRPIREVASMGRDVTDLVPEPVARRLAGRGPSGK